MLTYRRFKPFQNPAQGYGALLLASCFLSLHLGCGPSSSTGSSSNRGEVQEISFGIIATESTVGLRKEFEPFLEDMSNALRVPVKSYFASDYAGVIEAMRFGKVDLGWFGNKSAIEAVDRAGGEVFAQTVPAEGEPGYWSTIIVHTDSPYQSVDDLLANAKELAFGNGDPHSTSGFLIPSYYLWRKYKVDPKKTFKAVLNSNHETNALSVASEQVDFATCSTEVLAQIEAQRPETFQKLRVVWKSPLIPSDPFVWRKELPEAWKQRISEFILNYGLPGPEQEHQLDVLSKISAGWAPLRASTNDQLLPLREMILANKIEALERENSSREQDIKQIEDWKADLAAVQARSAEISETDRSASGEKEAVH